MMQGCIKEVYDGDYTPDTKLATLTIDILSDGFATKADNISTLEEDYIIKSLRVFAIDDTGAIEVNEYTNDIKVTQNGIYYSFDVIQAEEKLIYVVLNEPSSLSETLDNVSNQFDLTMLNYQIAESLNNEQFVAGASLAETNKMIPMSAMVKINATGDKKIVVHVDRVVARVDLMIDKDKVAYTSNVEFNSSTTVNVSGLYYTTSLFPSQKLPTPKSSDYRSVSDVDLNKTTILSVKNDSRSTAKRLLSFYMAERTYDIDPETVTDNRIAINIDNITVDGELKELNSTILLGRNVQPYIEEINRNYVYRIYATYKGEEVSLEVNDEYAIEDWTVEELDGDIEGVMIAVENQIVMDWLRLKNSFSANDVAFGSNRSIDFYIPSSYDEVNDKYEFKRCKIVPQAGTSYDLRDMSQYGVPDADNYLLSIPWLTKARIVFSTPNSGHFEFTYKLGRTPDHQDKVHLQLVSANVRKEIEVLYDNGYVPGDILQANDTSGCWDDATSGIVFAKRGDALHPLTTETVLTYNSEGLYEGDITLSADAADQYCKDNLGEKWYAPNKAQLADIQKHVLELGTSYRYNNSPNSLYWSSESVDAVNYWLIDFTKGLDEPAPLSQPAAIQYYVRCITNL